MRFAGIDIGSRTIEVVVVDHAKDILLTRRADTGFAPMKEVDKLLKGVEFDGVMATGYGRNLFEVSFDAPTVTEIKAHAWGARAAFRNAKPCWTSGPGQQGHRPF